MDLNYFIGVNKKLIEVLQHSNMAIREAAYQTDVMSSYLQRGMPTSADGPEAMEQLFQALYQLAILTSNVKSTQEAIVQLNLAANNLLEAAGKRVDAIHALYEPLAIEAAKQEGGIAEESTKAILQKHKSLTMDMCKPVTLR